jgi:hypothetical protein
MGSCVELATAKNTTLSTFSHVQQISLVFKGKKYGFTPLHSPQARPHSNFNHKASID